MTFYVMAGREKLIGCLPRDAVGAEIGVFAGDFAAEILAAAVPRELHLVDAWKFVAFDWYKPNPSGPAQQSEAFSRYLKAAEPEWSTEDPSDGLAMLHNRVTRRFADDPRVRIARGLSSEVLATYPDGYFDFLYIDANHDYHPLLSDLWSAHRILKKGGLILGHDFDMDRGNRWSIHNVIEAVMSFCKNSNFKLMALSSDLGSTYVLGESPPSSFATEFLRRMIGLGVPVVEFPQEIAFNYRRIIVRTAGKSATMVSSFRS